MYCVFRRHHQGGAGGGASNYRVGEEEPERGVYVVMSLLLLVRGGLRAFTLTQREKVNKEVQKHVIKIKLDTNGHLLFGRILLP